MSTHLPDYVYHVSFGRYRPLKLPLSCEVVEKGDFRPPICRGWDIPDFRHAFSNCTQFRACGRFWLSSVQRLRKEEEEESVVKHKSADMYVGRPNKSKLPVVIAGFDVPLDTSQLISETSIHLNSAISASSTVTK